MVQDAPHIFFFFNTFLTSTWSTHSLHDKTLKLFLGLGGKVLLELTLHGGLFLKRLEATVAKLARCIDKLEVNLLRGAAACVGAAGLAELERALLAARGLALDHQKVRLDLTIVRKATHGGNGLGRCVVLSLGVVRDHLAVLRVVAYADAVNLLVHLRAVVVAVLTGTRHRVAHTAGVPGANTGDLAQTLVRLARELLSAPAVGYALKAVALGDANDINHFVLIENVLDGNVLLEELLGEINLVSHAAAVDLNLHNVSLLQAQVELVSLRVGNDAHNMAVLGNARKAIGHGLLTVVRLGRLGVLGKGLLLGAHVVFVETALGSLANVRSPHGGERAEATRGLGVANHANDAHGRRLDNSDGLHNLLLVALGTCTVHLAHNVSHACLVAHKGSKVAVTLLFKKQNN